MGRPKAALFLICYVVLSCTASAAHFSYLTPLGSSPEEIGMSAVKGSQVPVSTLEAVPTGSGPSLYILSPANTTYNSSSVDLIWFADPAAARAAYSLNGAAQNQLEGNTTISGLEEGSYELTVYAEDSDGGSSSTAVFFTIDWTPPRIYHTPIETAIREQAIVVSAIVKDETGVGDVHVYYRTPGQVNYTAQSLALCVSCGDLYRAVLPRAITSANQVEYYIVASDGVNTASIPASAPESNPFVITIRNLLLPVTLSNSSGVTDSSVALSWTSSGSAEFKNYTIYQSSSKGAIGTPVAAIAPKSVTTYTVTGLTPETTYYFTVRVYDASGYYADSNQISVTTAPAPAPPAALYVAAATIALAAGLAALHFVRRKSKMPQGRKSEPRKTKR